MRDDHSGTYDSVVVGSIKLVKTEPKPNQLIIAPAKLTPPQLIPPRQWLYGTQLIRGFVTVLVAPGGTGKSSYAMVAAACCVTGRSLLGEHVFERVNAVVLNLEDPMDELDRRLAAIMIRHELSEADLRDRYFMHSSEDRPIAMAEMDDDGYTIIYPDEAAVCNQVLEHQIGLIVVDPFSESHSLEENSNPHMVKAVAAWRRVARATGAAVLIVHHVRKGTSVDIDAARGAKATTDSARVGLLMSAMTQHDAELFGKSENERHAYVRLDDAKANMAPKAERARWFQLDRVPLGNSSAIYPNGDSVAVIVPWTPPTAFADMSMQMVVEILEAIQDGPEPGQMYTAARQGQSNERWAGWPVVNISGKPEEQAATILKKWLEEGMLEKQKYLHPKTRKQVPGLSVNAAKLSEMRQAFRVRQFDE